VIRAAVVVVLAILAVPSVVTAQKATRAFDVKVTGSGAPMILIPGLACSGEVWDSTVERFRDRYRLHVLTLAGFGGPAPVAPPFLAQVRDAIVEYVRAEQLAKPVIVGHSLGGFLAFWVAATVPDLVGGVIAVDGVPFLPGLTNPGATEAANAPQAEMVRKMYAGFSRDQLLVENRKALSGMITAPADVERASRWAERADAASVGQAVAEMMTTDLRDEVSSIAAPALLVAALGGAPASMHEAFRKAYESQVARIRRGQVVASTTARHFVMLDDPEFLFSAMNRFLAALPEGR